MELSGCPCWYLSFSTRVTQVSFMIHWSWYTYALCKALHLSSRNANSLFYFQTNIFKITLDFDTVSLGSRQIDFVTSSSLVETRYLKEFLLEKCELRYATGGKRTKGKVIILLTSLAFLANRPISANFRRLNFPLENAFLQDKGN